ncbi:MAG: fructose-1,6-bisphosphatase [Paludibacteraceae bacterium]|nr:fructose-1,6-bisphosphatase [Paludibacteraceae bacterium]
MKRTIDESQLPYLRLLSKSFPTIAAASTEIINLEAIMNLPKGTEYFLSDIHGEYEAFQHVMKNASGSVQRKVNELFGDTLREQEKRDLCTLIYYPRERLEMVKPQEKNLTEWYMVTLIQLVKVCQAVSAKYTRSKVRKALPAEFSYIIQELMHESLNDPNKQAYLKVILSTIININRADEFIVALSEVIQRLIIDSLHIVGDIYDRGPGAHIIMDTLMNYHDVDIQWGNHDILWMGAACGNESCIANVIRICMRYGNLTTLEDGYGINLLPLATFAMDTYGSDPCTVFQPKLKFADVKYSDKNAQLIAKMQKAISIIQFKLEAAIIARHKEYNMDDRNLLHCIDFERGVLKVNGQEYAMLDMNFPTVNPADPYALTPEEAELIAKLRNSFVNSERLHKHMRFFFTNGSMYLVQNGNLMFHASIPLNEDGTFKQVTIGEKQFSGKALLDEVDRLVREAYFKNGEPEDQLFALDYMWYLWCGADAAPFDKSKMATFERYFVAEKELHKEVKGHYYKLREQAEVCERILDEFGVTGEHRHIINGHVPVKTIKGENPIKADGKMFVIDGGFSRAYQPETGIAGYTLVYNSQGLQLVQHEPFTSAKRAVEEGLDIKSMRTIVEFNSQRMLVRDTDKGRQLQREVDELRSLLVAYRYGLVKENNK